MSFINNILSRFRKQETPEINVPQKRAYDAAKSTRLNSDFFGSSGSINRDLRSDRFKVNARARTLWQNSALVRRYRNASRVNIIGHEGFDFSNQAKLPNGEFDKVTNNYVEEKFYEWFKREYCTMQGMFSFVPVCWHVNEQFKREGEFLVMEHYGKDVNKFGYSLEPMEPEWIEHNLNVVLDNGNVILMGIELNKWRKIVAFWFKDYSVKNELNGFFPSVSMNQLNRIPVQGESKGILFGFDPEYANQGRGISPLAQVMLTINDLDGYRKAAVIAARAGASKMGFITKSIDGPDYVNDGVDAEGNATTDFTPGVIEELEPGQGFTGFDPDYPHEQYGPFTKEHKRDLASGLGMAYNSFANDLEGVNFSSMRSGALEERDMWLCDQTLFRELFLIPLYSNWLKWSILSGEVKLPYSKYEQYNKPFFQGRRWQWVDPRNDVEASRLAIQMGLSNPVKEATKLGGNYFENIDAIAEAKKYADEKGVVLGEVKADPANKNDNNSADPETNNDVENKKEFLKRVV